jgi:IS30 family transposase
VTRVERQPRYVILTRVANKETASVVTGLIKQARKLPRELYQSLTWDRGKELADHQRFTLATEVDVCFVIPKARGSAVPTKTPIVCCANICPRGPIFPCTGRPNSAPSPANSMSAPRKTLMYQTPAEMFAERVAATH